ncbi:MAG TPA: CHAT domain-containing protein [Candidatus Acidoferrales bacterium]|nr:CHAT domain-containing protein [Candidatus Acidoferrales bacterium]
MEPEDYLNVAVVEWLPRRWEDARYERALGAVAERLVQQHGDLWLRDVMAARRSDGEIPGLRELAAATQANLEDETEEALQQSREAARRLRAAGDSAGALRADVELIYALHWSAASAAECISVARTVASRAEAARYSWILGQALIDRGNCRSITGKSGAAHSDMRLAMELTHRASYRDLELRAGGILADARTQTGNFAASWTGARARLEEYWRSPHSGIRAQQIYFGLARSAKSLGLPQAAYRLQDAAVRAIGQTPHRRLEATAWTELARCAVAAGRPLEAGAAFDRADRLFHVLKPTDTIQRFRALADLDRAEAQIDSGEAPAALRVLDDVRPRTTGLADAHLIEFQALTGDGLRSGGATTQAEAAYLRAIELSERGLSNLHGSSERAQLITAASRPYRGLVQMLWERGDSEGALRRWEWFRAAGALKPAADLGLDQRLKRLRNESFLSYVMMRGQAVAWLFDDRGIAGRRLSISSGDLDAVAARFLRECADPGSDRQALTRDARQLYDWLVAPLAERLDPGRTLVIEPDGPVAAVPMQALMDEHFRYLGERFAIAVAGGLADYQTRLEAGPVDADRKAVVVANPVLAGDTVRTFPPLRGSMREGQAVAAIFRGSVLLSGTGATIPALEEHRREAEVLHFAGHGFSNGGDGGLLLSPVASRPEDAGVLEGNVITGQDWSRCRLAVLSACSAGTGEARGPVNPDSLVRRFLWAGVARVVASRWNVEDEGGPFMEQFYADLLSGKDAAAALREAARQVREKKSTNHPYYWAGFQVFGSR